MGILPSFLNIPYITTPTLRAKLRVKPVIVRH